MAAKKPKLKKAQHDAILANMENRLQELYRRAASHIPFEVTDEQAMLAFVREDDLPYVRRSRELFGHFRDHYASPGGTLVLRNFPGSDAPVTVGFERSLSWMPPRYLTGDRLVSDLPETAVALLEPYVSQANEFYRLLRTSLQGWKELCQLCDHQLNRMLYLWPALAVMAKEFERIDLSILPRPMGVPSLTPELREKLTMATTFVNMVMLMPEWKAPTGNVRPRLV